jgi:hypothetical protein
MAIRRLAIKGYGQLELNQVAFRRDGRIEAQCKLNDEIEYVENGMILAIDQATRTVNYPGTEDDFVALHYSTEHMYDERAKALKDFKLDNGTFLPRLGYLATGDKFTTNCVSINTEAEEVLPADVEAIINAKAAYGHTCANGSILIDNVKDGAIVKVVKATTMPDGSFAVKFIAL